MGRRANNKGGRKGSSSNRLGSRAAHEDDSSSAVCDEFHSLDVAACANRYANDSEKIGKDVQRMERDWKDQDMVLEHMNNSLGACAKEKIDKLKQKFKQDCKSMDADTRQAKEVLLNAEMSQIVAAATQDRIGKEMALQKRQQEEFRTHMVLVVEAAFFSNKCSQTKVANAHLETQELLTKHKEAMEAMKLAVKILQERVQHLELKEAKGASSSTVTEVTQSPCNAVYGPDWKQLRSLTPVGKQTRGRSMEPHNEFQIFSQARSNQTAVRARSASIEVMLRQGDVVGAIRESQTSAREGAAALGNYYPITCWTPTALPSINGPLHAADRMRSASMPSSPLPTELPSMTCLSDAYDRLRSATMPSAPSTQQTMDRKLDWTEEVVTDDSFENEPQL